MARRGFRAKMGLLALALAGSLAATGVASASWPEEVTLSGTVATASLDVAFTGVRVAEQQGPGSASVRILPGGKALAVEIAGAWTGTAVEIVYTVLNQGTIPVVAEPQAAAGEGIVVEALPPPCLEAGAEGRGRLTVAVVGEPPAGGAIEAGRVWLEFRQWNR